jgi:hypothetical protein
VVDVGGDAAILGVNGDDDGVRTATASTWMGSVMSIGSGRLAGRWLESGGVCGDTASNLKAWGRVSLRVLERRERGRRGFYRRGKFLGERLGFRGDALHRTVGVASVSERDSVMR